MAAAFATALGWAVSAYVPGVVGRMAGPVGVTMLRQPFQLAALGIVCLLLGEETFLSLKGLGLLTVSGITGFICCDLLLYGAMGIIGPQAAIQLASLSSGVTALLGMFFLGERLPLQAVAGIIITLVGVAIVLTERTGSTLLPGQEVPTGRRLVLGTAAGLGAAVDSPFDSDLAAPSPPSARLRFLSPSFLKSVSYQPLPARRNAGAVTCRFTVDWPQEGQVSGSGSDSFCRRSKRWPHWVHSKA